MSYLSVKSGSEPISTLVYGLHFEGPLKLFARVSARSDADGHQELLEVDPPVAILVECPVDVLAELLGVAALEEALVDLHELGFGELAVRTVHLEALIPVTDLLLRVIGVLPEELNVFVGQFDG